MFFIIPILLIIATWINCVPLWLQISLTLFFGLQIAINLFTAISAFGSANNTRGF